MMTEVIEDPSLTGTLEEVLARVATLTARVSALEATADVENLSVVGNGRPKTGHPDALHEDVSEEILMVISAAVAAFLGKTPPIRQIQLVSSTSWARQGRVGIHASHAFAAHPRSGASS